MEDARTDNVKHKGRLLTLVKGTAAIVSIVMGLVALVLWAMNLGPHGDPKPSVTDWISAIATVIGAVGTAGALSVAAFTYKHQVDEKNRAAADKRKREFEARSEQARAIKVFEDTTPTGTSAEKTYIVRNDSDAPIDYVGLTVLSMSPDTEAPTISLLGTIIGHESKQAPTLQWPDKENSFLTFHDGNGSRWRRYFNGRLAELGRYDFDELEVVPSREM